ncbi:MAG: CHASE2 domain-containing protein [Cyanobacteria bacterium P01_A01_bin.105]
MSWETDGQQAAQALCDRTRHWLNHPHFQPLYNKILEQLSPEETIRVVLQTADDTLRRLPWNHWDFFDRYPFAELTLSTPAYQQRPVRSTHRRAVRVLAVFGDATGLDLAPDQALLEKLPGIELCLLTTPDRQALNQTLWASEGWDILFFAGHSNSFIGHEGRLATGYIGLNPQDKLTIPDLQYALAKAVERGLTMAIFNSCDGLGLAQDLATLQISQVLVMREPVPDAVAHAFLKHFLHSFAQDKPLHLAVREAREQLHGMEDTFPGAAWLPILCQNLAHPTPRWSALRGACGQGAGGPKRDSTRVRLGRAIAGSVAVAAVTLGVEWGGGFQRLELAAYDFFLRHRPRYEQPDDRIVIIENTTADVQRLGTDARTGASLRDETLQALLDQLEPAAPRVVGLDIYHPHPFDPALPQLPQRLNAMDNLATVCKHPAPQANLPGIELTAELTPGVRLGFSDLFEDTDRVARRQMLVTDLQASTPCPAEYSFAVAIAVQYLDLAQPGDRLNDLLWPPQAQGQLQLQQTVLPRLRPQAGGYRLGKGEQAAYQMMIHYRHLPDLRDIAVQRFTVSEVLSGQVKTEYFRDKVVLIGTTDVSFGGGDMDERDLWRTPYTTSDRPGELLPGVFLQAHLISQLLSTIEDRRPSIESWHEAVERGWTILWAGLGGMVGWRCRGQRFWFLLITTEVGLFLVCWGLLAGAALWVPWVPSAVALAGAGSIVWGTTCAGDNR